jgi:hypothetical protein
LIKKNVNERKPAPQSGNVPNGVKNNQAAQPKNQKPSNNLVPPPDKNGVKIQNPGSSEFASETQSIRSPAFGEKDRLGKAA